MFYGKVIMEPSTKVEARIEVNTIESGVKTMADEKKRVLWYGDSPTGITGFGQVSRNLLREMFPPDSYHLTILGINYHGEPFDWKDYPYLQPDKASPLDGLWPAKDDQSIYGFNKLLAFVRDGNFDLVCVLQDPAVLGVVLPGILKQREELAKKFKLIFYFPIDGTPRKQWVDDIISKVDYPVVYTEYGRKEIDKINTEVKNLHVIGHGTEPKSFYPIVGPARALIRKLLFPGMPEDIFVVLNVNRNQPRKDPLHTFEAFAKFHKKFPKSFLFFHAAHKDKGGNLVDMAESFGLVQGRDWSCPDPKVFNTLKGIPIDILNQLYSACDLLISTTHGEGWGLSITEAMCCKVPVLAPRNSSIEEIIGENQERGTFIKCGGPSHWVSLGQEDPIPMRPVVDVDDMVEKMLNIARYPKKYQKRTEAAYEWAMANTWESKGEVWRQLVQEAIEAQEDENGKNGKTTSQQETSGNDQQPDPSVA